MRDYEEKLYKYTNYLFKIFSCTNVILPSKGRRVYCFRLTVYYWKHILQTLYIIKIYIYINVIKGIENNKNYFIEIFKI